MNGRRLFSSGNFAKLSRTSRSTLHLYDNIGLLSPHIRGENNYRYYTAEQISIVNVIRILQKFGMTLSEMIGMKNKRSPDLMSEILLSNIGKIDEKIEEWVSVRKLLTTLQKAIQSVVDIDEELITVQLMPSENILLGKRNDYSKGKDAYNALYEFYSDMQARFPDLDLNYPVWGRVDKNSLLEKRWKYPDNYYFYNPEGTDERPAGVYAIGYTRGGYGQAGDLFSRIVDFIDESGYEISGDAYEEYPLNEFCIPDVNNYLIRVMVSVRKKQRVK